MKKFKYFILGAITSLSIITSITYAQTFSDENNFSEWFKSSVMKMQNHHIIEGYTDGKFKPENFVNRAELSTILDRYAENIVDKKLMDNENCTEQANTGLIIYLQNQDGNPINKANFSVNGFGDSNPMNQIKDNGIYYGFTETAGHFSIEIKKEGYKEHKESIKIEKDFCHVITEIRTITLIANKG